jgi:hypothetical protein
LADARIEAQSTWIEAEKGKIDDLIASLN